MSVYILFDLDGTLTDPKEGITRCVQYALSKFGIQTECEALTRFIGPPLAESFERFYGLSRAESERAVCLLPRTALRIPAYLKTGSSTASLRCWTPFPMRAQSWRSPLQSRRYSPNGF